MVSAFLVTVAEKTQAIPTISPFTHPVLGWKNIPESQPKHEGMSRNSHRKSDRFPPRNNRHPFP